MQSACVLALLTALLIAASTAGAINVTRFGARPNDDGDDTAAFVAAAEAVQAGPDRVLLIPPGRYLLRADGNPKRPDTLMPFAGIRGLRIDGRGAELLMTGSGTVFGVAECRDVRVRGLTIDWERPPFSEGTVVASAPRHFDVEVRPGYPVRGGEPVGAFMSYDPVTRLPLGGDFDVYNSVTRTELVRPQVLRVHMPRDIPVPVGTLLVLRHQVYGYNALAFYRCANVDVRDVTVHTVPGMGLVGIQTTDIALRRFHVRLRPGSDRLMTATADATHFGGCKGAVTLEDCVFEGMGDDGANIKSGLYLLIRQRIDDRTVLGQHNLKMADVPDKGDVMEMMPTATLIPYGSGVVASAALEPGTENLHRVQFTEPLPADLREGDVLGNASRAPQLRMRRCTVRANRARGVLCQTRDAMIEDCLFQHCTGAGVLVLTEVVHFHESIGTRNVTVRNNRFDECNAGAAQAEAPLSAVAWLKDFAYPREPGVHRDVLFEGNRITGAPGSAIFAVGVDGFTARGNVIVQAGRAPRRPHDPAAIAVMDCARVTVTGNRADPASQGAGFREAVRITPPAK